MFAGKRNNTVEDVCYPHHGALDLKRSDQHPVLLGGRLFNSKIDCTCNDFK